MESVGQLPSLRATQAFTDYLKTQNINFDVRVTTEQDIEHYSIWVTPEDFEFARQHFFDFVQNPHDSKFLNASWEVNQPSSTKSSLGLSKLYNSVGPLTRWITVLCIAIYTVSYLGWYREVFQVLGFSFDLTEPYRLVTPAIMHLSMLHLAFNIAWWWYLGGRVEKILGLSTLAILFVVSAAFSNVLQALLESPNFAGLSGVNYALAGFAWACGVFHQSRTLYLPNNLFMFLLVWMVIGFFDVLPINMANWAHLGGLLAGIGLSFVLVKRTNSSSN